MLFLIQRSCSDAHQRKQIHCERPPADARQCQTVRQYQCNSGEANDQTGTSSLVVDTGPWIFGRKVLLPAGVVEKVDHDDKKVYVDRTKDQIKDAPEYNSDADVDDDYRTRLGGYYDDTYRSGM